MKRICRLGVISLFLASPLLVWAQDARQQFDGLLDATALDRQDMEPWHLRMSFQLYDLNGKPSETGTIEEWWINPGRHRHVVVRSSEPPKESLVNGTKNRESYLVELLRDQVVHPIPTYRRSDDVKITEANRKFGKVELTCMVAAREKVNPHELAEYLGPQYCITPGTSALRIVFDSGGFSAIRNAIGTFRNIEIGVDNTLSYGGKLAITGHIEKLESYKPGTDAKSGGDALTEPDEELDYLTRMPGIIIAGRRTSFVQPVYPDSAKAAHISGAVLIRAIIDKKGMVASLDVIASPDPSLSQSAMDAVKKWEYKPYLLNGEPTEIDTAITVTYNLWR